MKAIFNSRLTNIESIKLDIANRAFCYGDGLFETIVTGASRINLIDFHLDRLKKACELMQMKPPVFTSTELLKMIQQLAKENGLQGTIRAKLQIWRDTGGLYTPTEKASSFLLQVAETNRPFFRQMGELGVSNTSSIHFTPVSFAKTISALPYVLAGIECRQRGLDDIILLNNEGHVSETHTSNIFWVKGDQVFTPLISTGCIAGIMRRYILEQIGVKQVTVIQEELQLADSIFSTNASGVAYFSHFGGKPLKSPEHLLYSIFKQPQQP